MEIGDYDEAEARCNEALAIRRETFGRANLASIQSLSNLAGFHRARGENAKAKAEYEEALAAICPETHAPPSGTAAILNSLGELYRETHDFVKAAEYYQKALAICQKLQRQKHPDTAMILNNLGELYLTMDENAKAERCYQDALAILQKVLGDKHPYTAVCLNGLGWLKIHLKDFNGARAFAQKSAKAELAVLNNILSFTSEQQRFAYRATLDPYSLFAALDGSDAELATTVLRYKGAVLDSVIEDHRVAEASKRPEDQERLARLNADKQQLRQLLLQTSTHSSGDINQKVEALQNHIKQIQGHFAGLVGGARQGLSVTVEQVQAALPQHGALIEYVRYARRLGKGKWEGRYGAVVLASSGQPRWIPLANEKAVDAAVSQYQSLVCVASDAGLAASLQSLYAQLWAPIERALPPDTKQVIISPDGQLNFVSFATLLLDSKEHFLAEKYTVQYVASGRDLLREASPPGERPAAVVFANPDFNKPASPASISAEETGSAAAAALPGGLNGTEKRGLESLWFDDLPLTEKQGNDLVSKFQEWHWTTAPPLTDSKASKAALRQVHGPYVLHLATHGYFMPAEPAASGAGSLPPATLTLKGKLSSSKFFANPMHRSWLVLAGANVTLDAWGKGQVPPVNNDGIVTAEEVSTLDLNGTWLVTLLACDTGSGEFKAGEGVLGLRRGVMQAGAQNLLMTLWPITGEKTTQIMLEFYKAARDGGNAPQALADVQRAWLKKLRDNQTQGLAQAVRLAGPFIMSFQGHPWARASALSVAPVTLGQGINRRRARYR